jgi:glycerophosphoryl diester phosphodiesterase
MGELTAFDLQAHRGGAGLRAANTLRAFGNALDIGVSTLELDVQISNDRVAMVSHDRVLPDGEFISWLPRAALPLDTLADVIALVEERAADEVRLNVETKFDPVHPDEVAPRERFVEVVVATLRAADLVERTSIQCFDWDVLDLVRRVEPGLRLNVLTNTAYLEIGLPGASPWMAGTDIDEYGGDVVRAATNRGYTALSPSHSLITGEMVDEAHAAGLQVIPYTVDEPSVMEHLLDLGVDGLITNRPDVLRRVLAARGLPLPRRYPAPGVTSPDS